MTEVNEGAIDLVEVIRGDRVESVHRGHIVVCDGAGEIVEAWGDPSAVIYPRSACKMVQALPLLESGAGAHLTSAQLALASASHEGAAVHVAGVNAWLRDLAMSEQDLRCGTHMPYSDDAKADLIRAGDRPCQLHNNCSGKHAGFLALSKHLGAGPEYVEPDHPVQLAVRRAFEEVTGMDSPGYGIDGCSAPNFATRLDAFGRAMGLFAGARDGGGLRQDAMVRLTRAMGAEPMLVAGEGRACTDLMRAMGGARGGQDRGRGRVHRHHTGAESRHRAQDSRRHDARGRSGDCRDAGSSGRAGRRCAGRETADPWADHELPGQGDGPL